MRFFIRNCLLLLALALLSWASMAASARGPVSGEWDAMQIPGPSTFETIEVESSNHAGSSAAAAEQPPVDVVELEGPPNHTDRNGPQGEDDGNELQEELQELAYLAPSPVGHPGCSSEQDCRRCPTLAPPQAALDGPKRPPRV